MACEFCDEKDKSRLGMRSRVVNGKVKTVEICFSCLGKKLMQDGKLLSNSLSTYKVPDIYSAPKNIEITFRLPLSFKTITAQVEIMRVQNINESLSAGCKFINLPKDIENKISKFVFWATESSPSCIALSIASLILFADALLRIFAYFLNAYYIDTTQTAEALSNSAPNHYIMPLSLYAVAAVPLPNASGFPIFCRIASV